MAITDADQLAEIAWRVVEADTTFTSGLWTVTEIANYFNQRQNQFNRDTKLMLAHQPLAFTAGQTVADLPQDWIASLNGSWTDSPTGKSTTVAAGDRYAAEKGISATNNPPLRPIIFDDGSAGPLKLELFPVPVTDGELELLYASVLAALAFDPGTPDIFNLPDEVVPYVTYGVLADMLSKDGRGQDLARAAYCEQRYQEGVALAAVLLEGFL